MKINMKGWYLQMDRQRAEMFIWMDAFMAGKATLTDVKLENWFAGAEGLSSLP